MKRDLKYRFLDSVRLLQLQHVRRLRGHAVAAGWFGYLQLPWSRRGSCWLCISVSHIHRLNFIYRDKTFRRHGLGFRARFGYRFRESSIIDSSSSSVSVSEVLAWPSIASWYRMVVISVDPYPASGWRPAFRRWRGVDGDGGSETRHMGGVALPGRVGVRG